jgi:agmatinase
MTNTLTVPPRQTPATFLYSEYVSDLKALHADIAFLGIPYGQAYNYDDIVNDQTNSPTAMRAASIHILRGLERYDFDLGGTLYDGHDIRTVDCGDIRADPTDRIGHVTRSEEAVRHILAAGAMPIILGGDHAIPIPVLRAFDSLPKAKEEPITLIQIDQHIDWREEVNGVRGGLSSPIRRASEMSHIGEIFQIGLRATGSARTEEVEAAHAYGAHLISAYELHEHGVAAILAKIPDRGRYYLTVDMDGMDPSVAPAVNAPAPGGVTFLQARAIIHGLVRKGRVVGMDVVEITPKHDVNRITCITAGRLIVNMIGQAVRAGYFSRNRPGQT